MTPEQHAHMEEIVAAVSRDIRTKYPKGQRDHGGNLWEHVDLIDRAIEEAVDQVCYLYSLRRQLAHLTGYVPPVPALQEAYAHRGDVPPFEE